MPYLSGLLTGIVLTVLVLFLIDQYGSGPDRQMVVNWGVLTQRLAHGVGRRVDGGEAYSVEAPRWLTTTIPIPTFRASWN